MIADAVARIIVQQAIIGKTLAGAKVLNSPMMSLKEIVDASPSFAPIVVVSSSEHEMTITGQDTQAGAVKATLTINVLTPPSAQVTMDGRMYEVKGQGAFASLISDIIIAQSLQALRDTQNPWARLWTRIAPRLHKISKGQPYLEVDESLALPARLLTIEYQPISDPVAGRPMTETYQAFYDLMLGDPGLRVLAPMLRQAIEDPSVVPDWAYAMMQIGLSDAAAMNTGVMPLEPTGDSIGQVGAYETDPEDDPNIIVPDTNEGAV